MPNITRVLGPDGWLAAAADWGRLIWAAFYWNAAKTLFRLRGARGPAPCQHPSDSGREGESFCDACVGLTDPRRFARICPLIRYDSPSGPRCAVAAARVRPFWGRVLVALGVAGTVGALLTAGAALVALRAVGYRVKPADVLWPPHWNRVHEARADYYERLGLAAYARGDARACYLALLQAHVLRPDDFAIDRLLAQVAQTLDPELADDLFANLVQSPDPHRAANAAEQWAPALLARCSFSQLAQLSADMLHRGGPDAAAWTNALVFSTAHLPDASLVRRVLAQPGPPDAASRAVLAWSLQAGSEKLNTELLAAGRDSPSVYLRHYALQRLIRAGQAAAVLPVLTPAAGLPPREAEELRLAAWGELKWTEPRRREIEGLVGGAEVSPGVVEMLAAQLISYPDRRAAELLFGAVERHPPAPTPANYPSYAALACLAGVERDAARLNALTALLGKIAERPFGRATQVSEVFLDRAPNHSLSPALVALQPLPLEVMFAILADYPHPPAGPAEEPKAHAAR
jgi:hypothetical protein